MIYYIPHTYRAAYKAKRHILCETSLTQYDVLVKQSGSNAPVDPSTALRAGSKGRGLGFTVKLGHQSLSILRLQSTQAIAKLNVSYRFPTSI